MLITPTRENLNKVVVLNPKGGCGKSTIATNLAACYSRRTTAPAIMDYDPQGSTLAWLERRPDHLPEINGIAAFKKSMQATRSWQLRIPNDTENLIVDSPASMHHDDLARSDPRRNQHSGAGVAVAHGYSRGISLHRGSAVGRQGRSARPKARRYCQSHAQEHQELRQTDAVSRLAGHPNHCSTARQSDFVQAAEKGCRHCRNAAFARSPGRCAVRENHDLAG